MIRAAALALALACALPALAQQPAGDWPAIAAPQEASPDELLRMAAAFPNNGQLQLHLAQTGIEAGDAASTGAALRHFAEMGGVLSPGGFDAAARVLGPGEVEELRARMASNAVPVTASRPAGAVPAELGLIEGLASVPFMDNLLASSVTRRAIYGRAGRRWEEYAEGDRMPGNGALRAGSPMGMVYDFRRGWLWVASSAVDQTPRPETAFSGLIGIGPGRDEVLWLGLDGDARPGDVALGPDGAAYLSAAGNGAIYVRRIGGVELERLVPAGRLRSPQGMAVSPDGSALIIADYAYGLARLDLATGALDRLIHDGPAMLDGIDGLLSDGESLIAIRNGVAPHAILRLRIDPAGRTVTAVETIERAHPEWGEPTLGTIADGTLYYVSAARWDQFGEGGRADPAAPPRPTPIRAVDLGR